LKKQLQNNEEYSSVVYKHGIKTIYRP